MGLRKLSVSKKQEGTYGYVEYSVSEGTRFSVFIQDVEVSRMSKGKDNSLRNSWSRVKSGVVMNRRRVLSLLMRSGIE